MDTGCRNTITLCGVKHAGKSSAAAALSKLTGFPCFDSDDTLREVYSRESGESLSVREIYRKLGEEAFRRLEVRALRSLFTEGSGRIIALGGGVLSNPFLSGVDRENMGFLCCIDVSDRIAYERILAGGLPPFLQEKADPFQAFCEMNSVRRTVFRREADLIIESDPETTPEKTAEKIMFAYQNGGGK